MGTSMTCGSLDLDAGMLTSPMGLGGSCLSFEGWRSVCPPDLALSATLAPYQYWRGPQIKVAKFIGDNTTFTNTKPKVSYL